MCVGYLITRNKLDVGEVSKLLALIGNFTKSSHPLVTSVRDWQQRCHDDDQLDWPGNHLPAPQFQRKTRARSHRILILMIVRSLFNLHDISSTICKEMKFTDLDADGSADVVESSSSCRRRREPLLTIHRPDLPRDIAASCWSLSM